MDTKKLVINANKVDDINKNVYYFSYYRNNPLINTDDSAIDKLIEEVNLNSNPVKVVFNIPEITITKPIFFGRGNIEVDFNNCKITFQHNGFITSTEECKSLAIATDLGVINFHGTIDEEKSIVDSFTRVKTDTIRGGYYGKLTLTQPFTDTVTDKTYLRLSLKEYDSDNQELGKDKPYILRLVRVLEKIDNLNYIVDYSPKYEFKNLQSNKKWGGVSIAHPLTNIKIKNVNIYDDNIYSVKSGEELPDDVKNECINGISILRCDNISINNVRTDNMSCCGVKTTESNNITVKDSYSSNPTVTCAGHGYNLKFGASDTIYVEHATSDKVRHTVDFSGSSNAYVLNCNGANDVEASFLCHGIYEHYITFEKCIGSSCTGANLTLGARSDDVTYKNCKLNNYYSCFGRNVNFYDCELSLMPSSTTGIFPNIYKSLKFNNCNIYMKKGNYYGYNADVDNTKREMIFNNCEITIEDYTSINAFDSFILSNCRMIGKNDNTSTPIELRNLIDFKVCNGSDLININFNLNNDYKNITMSDTLIENNYAYSILDFSTYSSNVRNLFLKSVHYVYLGSGNARLVQIKGDVPSEIKERISLVSCCIGGNEQGSLFPVVLWGTVTNIKSTITAVGNVFNNIKPEEGKFDKNNFQENIWINC